MKAAWTGVPLVSIPIGVRYFQGEERVSHMRPVRDFLRIGRLNTRLVTCRICLPAPFLRWTSLAATREQPWRRCWREGVSVLLLGEPSSPSRTAASVGLGLFLGIAPIWGFQGALTLVLAHALGLSKPVALVASNISFPLMIPPITFASIVLGRFVLGEGSGTRSVASLHFGPADIPAWIAGSLLLALLVATVGAALTYLLLLLRGADRKAAGARLPPA